MDFMGWTTRVHTNIKERETEKFVSDPIVAGSQCARILSLVCTVQQDSVSLKGLVVNVNRAPSSAREQSARALGTA